MSILIYENNKLGKYDESKNLNNYNFIDFVSDIHCDFYIGFVKNFDELSVELRKNSFGLSNNLVIAGDISNRNKHSLEMLKSLLKRWEKIYIISGNHDHYNPPYQKDRYQEFKKLIEEEKLSNSIIFFDEEIVDICGIKVFGSFMIYDIDDMNVYFDYKYKMNDSKFIKEPLARRLYNKSIKAYNEKAKDADVIVSHIPLATRRIDIERNRMRYGEINYCYFNNSVEIFPDKLYIHGHTHNRDFTISDYGAPFANVSLGYPAEVKTFSPMTIGFHKNKNEK